MAIPLVLVVLPLGLLFLLSGLIVNTIQVAFLPTGAQLDLFAFSILGGGRGDLIRLLSKRFDLFPL